MCYAVLTLKYRHDIYLLNEQMLKEMTITENMEDVIVVSMKVRLHPLVWKTKYTT